MEYNNNRYGKVLDHLKMYLDSEVSNSQKTSELLSGLAKIVKIGQKAGEFSFVHQWVQYERLIAQTVISTACEEFDSAYDDIAELASQLDK